MSSGGLFAKRPRLMQVCLLLASCLASVALFLLLDWLHGRAVHLAMRHALSVRTAKDEMEPTRAGCAVRDPVRAHAFKPNCADLHGWGNDDYEFFTNNLGFRDEKIRQIPLSEPNPRLLLLGDSFTEGVTTWADTYVAMIAAHFPNYAFLNGGVSSYSPSNYFNVAHGVLAAGVQFDEADEAGYYRDIDRSGAVAGLVVVALDGKGSPVSGNDLRGT